MTACEQHNGATSVISYHVGAFPGSDLWSLRGCPHRLLCTSQSDQERCGVCFHHLSTRRVLCQTPPIVHSAVVQLLLLYCRDLIIRMGSGQEKYRVGKDLSLSPNVFFLYFLLHLIWFKADEPLLFPVVWWHKLNQFEREVTSCVRITADTQLIISSY